MCYWCCDCLRRLWERLKDCANGDETTDIKLPEVTHHDRSNTGNLNAELQQGPASSFPNEGFDSENDGDRERIPSEVIVTVPESSATISLTPAQTEDEIVYIGLCFYQAGVPEDLGFAKSERLSVISKANGDWWYARSLVTGKEGYIPSNYVAPEGSYEAIEWYYGDISRMESENRLKNGILPDGAFLVRKAQHGQIWAYSLSVLKDNKVLHYKIFKLDNGCYTINRKSVYPSLDELINHYKEDADGLACPLTKPCCEMSITAPGLSKDCWEVDRKSLQFKTKIGAGQFGEVWLALWKGKSEVAVKKLKEGSTSTQEFLSEAMIMKTLQHKHLVRLFAISSDHEPIYIITEYMKNGALKDYLTKSWNGTIYLTTRHLIDMMAQIASGMAYLESKNYVHRDLAARNILVGENNTCKVSDFGLARLLQEDNGYYRANEGARLPIKWLSIESALRRIFTTKSDRWAFGILMFEIITRGKEPYPGMKNKEVVEAVENGYRMEQPKECPYEIYTIMLECWNENDVLRPPFKDLQETFERLSAWDIDEILSN